MGAERTYDHEVVIMGGGLAGLTLARQLRREIPSASVVVIERQKRPLPDAAHKVGESSVELSSHYFGVKLGLGDYLRKTQYIKNGLRFFPGGGTTHALQDRTEIGPPDLPRVPSFQLDRGRLESDLRAMDEADGVKLMEGFSVKDVELSADGDAHVVHYASLDGTTEGTLRARWVVDASGRRAIIRKKLGLDTPSGHVANASWWRVKGKVDVKDLVPASETAWHARDPENIRWYSTVHFMGTGYWFWYIPLATGYTSLGIVVHDEVHPFDTIRTLERSLAWVQKHEPRCYEQIKDLNAEDFLCLRHYSHGSKRCFSPDRWTCVGEAGVFADPFYSPGSDFIAISNSFTTELIKDELAGKDIRERAEHFDRFYLRFFDVATETYRKAAPLYGSPRAMAAKIYWDNFNYWSFVCQWFFKELYKLPVAEHEAFLGIAGEFAALSFRAQKLLSEWAKRSKDGPVPVAVYLPPIPSVLANLHLDLEKEMTIEETKAYMREKRVLAEEVVNEILLRALSALGPDEGVELARAVDLASWNSPISIARLEAEVSEGGARRRGLPPIARDMERCLGRAGVHEDVKSLPALLQHVMAAVGAPVAASVPIEASA
jgi:flavin-dependent dehydrogenase